jgi:phage-related protein
MAATTFTWTPSYGAQERSQPQVRSIKFGDGYEQRLTYGLNSDLKVWALSFNNVSTDVKQQITGFLQARGGSQKFNWTTPGSNGASKSFVCQEWDVTAVAPSRWTINAIFKEVVDL